LQETPEPHTTFDPAHPEELVWVQEPVPRSQQAPEFGMQALGEQDVPTPPKLLVPVQPEAMEIEHAPTPEQHAPLRALQGVAVQDVLAATNVPGLVQPDRIVTVQEPTPEQHAPRRVVQGWGVQAVPAPRKLLLPAQPLPPAFWAMKHPPTALQHAPPTSAHGEEVQVVPTPRNRPLHPSATVEVQTLAVEQQAPRRAAQGSGEQTVPLPW
jgi:hypothetical protein